MRVLGISPLDKDATASFVADGRILFAAGEERFSRQKQHAGFPERALRAGLAHTGWSLADVDRVVYPFLDGEREAELIRAAFREHARFEASFDEPPTAAQLRAADARVPLRTRPIHGLASPDQRMPKGAAKRAFYRLAGTQPALSRLASRASCRSWQRRAIEDHRLRHAELERGLRALGFAGEVEKSEHHLSHAANAYLASGFERALVVTLDGYGSGIAGSVSLGEDGRLERLASIPYPHSLGTLYEAVTSSLGFRPDRHAGKVVGLAAYGDPRVLEELLLARNSCADGDLRLYQNLNVYFSRHLASRYPVVDVAAAYQHVLEVLTCRFVAHWLARTGAERVVLSGGVTANVKLNQRIHELAGVRAIFVYPNMGDGGCGTGLALLRSWPGGVGAPLHDAYHGPDFGEAQLVRALDAAGLAYERPAHLARCVAEKIHAGLVVARFDGRMEYGPRALGNRSILYHGREASVNQWLNQRLGRTEFMPFAPVTLWEARDRCYRGVAGAEHTAEFMTITFDCTEFMRERCPAAVHVDGTARPQLIRREVNPGYYDILAEYEKLSQSPSLVNTSFNMHEEPIVCSPEDALRAFQDGRLDGLVLGPFWVSAKHPVAAFRPPRN